MLVGRRDDEWQDMMVNITCQFDWAMGSPDSWSTTILSITAKVFLD